MKLADAERIRADAERGRADAERFEKEKVLARLAELERLLAQNK